MTRRLSGKSYQATLHILLKQISTKTESPFTVLETGLNQSCSPLCPFFLFQVSKVEISQKTFLCFLLGLSTALLTSHRKKMLNPLKAWPYVCLRIHILKGDEQKANLFDNKERKLICSLNRVTKLEVKIAHFRSMF